MGQFILSVAVIAAMIPLGCVAPDAGFAGAQTSIVRLLSQPDRYDGKKVLLVGSLVSSDVRFAVFLSREHAENDLLLYGVALSRKGVDMREAERLSGRYVGVSGTYRARQRGITHYLAGQLEGVDVLFEYSPQHEEQ